MLAILAIWHFVQPISSFHSMLFSSSLKFADAYLHRTIILLFFFLSLDKNGHEKIADKTRALCVVVVFFFCLKFK